MATTHPEGPTIFSIWVASRPVSAPMSKTRSPLGMCRAEPFAIRKLLVTANFLGGRHNRESSRSAIPRTLRHFKRRGTPSQVNCADAAQRLSPLEQNRRVGARTRYKVDLKPDFRKRALRAHCTERIGRRKDYLYVGPSRFHTFKKLRRIRSDRIAGALHHHGVGRQRQAEIEGIEEVLGDSFTTHRIRGGETEVNAIESLGRAEIEISR